MIATLLVAGGFGSRARQEELTPIEDDDAPFEEIGDRGSVSLGWLVHAIMSAKARLWRVLPPPSPRLVASPPAPPQSFRAPGHRVCRGRAPPLPPPPPAQPPPAPTHPTTPQN